MATWKERLAPGRFARQLAILLLSSALGMHAFTLHAQETGGQWTGTWQSQWRGGGAVLRLRQVGDKVTGAYHLYQGTVEGSATGRELSGRWAEATGRQGAFLFVLSPEGDAFMGRFASGEWWTGTRLSSSADFMPSPPVLSSPRHTLRSFLRSANAARSGFIDELGPALDTIAFSHLVSEKPPGGPPTPQERIDYARMLFRVLDQLTFRIWSLPDPSEPGFPAGPATTVPLTQAGATNAFELRFVRQDNDWLIEPPAKNELAAALTRLLERHGGRAPGQRDYLQLRNPRDTMRTFFEEIRRFEESGQANVFRALDLQSFGGLVQEADAGVMALYLKQILDRIGFVLYQEIPDDPNQGDPYVHFRHRAGNIVIGPAHSSEGRTEWRFTGETLRSLRSLYEAIESMPVESGLRDAESASAHFIVRDSLRSVAPRLLRPLGPLEVWQWLALLAFLLTSVVVALVITRLVFWIVLRRQSWAVAFANPRARRALKWPLACLLIGGLWYLKLSALGLPAIVGGPFRRVAGSVAVGGAVWLLYRGVGLAGRLSNRTIGTTGQQAILASLSFGMLRVMVLVAGTLLLANIWSLPYSSVLAGLGIGGLAVALAAQPTLQNMIAGFTLFADSPLRVGDFCRFGDKLGTLENIGLRSTRVRTLERTVVSLPNSEFANLQLENFTQRDRVLLRTTVQLRYETTPDQLRFVLAELRRLLIGHPKIHPEPARVRFSGFGAHSLDVEVHAYVTTADWNEYLAVREDVLLRVMDLVRQSGTGFAFPSQVNYLARDSGTDPELTRKAEQAVAAWREASRLPFPEFPPAEVRQLDGRLDYPPHGSPQAVTTTDSKP